MPTPKDIWKVGGYEVMEKEARTLVRKVLASATEGGGHTDEAVSEHKLLDHAASSLSIRYCISLTCRIPNQLARLALTRQDFNYDYVVLYL